MGLVNVTTDGALAMHGIGTWGPYYVTSSIGAVIFVDEHMDVTAARTSDAGATWVPAQAQAGQAWRVAAWMDDETPGRTGGYVHVAWLDTVVGLSYTTNAAILKYATYDVLAGTWGTVRTVETGVNAGSDVADNRLYMTVARDGTIYIGYRNENDGTFVRHLYSTDGGASWTAGLLNAIEAANDAIYAFAANTGDNADYGLIYHDVSADEVSVKMYDASANTWTESSVSTGLVDDAALEHATGGGYNWFQIAMRLSDGHVMLAVLTQRVVATTDIKIWDITPDSIGAPTITAKTDAITNDVAVGVVALFIDQLTDDLYVTYSSSGSYPDSLSSYKVSTNGGSSWGAAVAYSTSVVEMRAISRAVMTASDGLFQPVLVGQSTRTLSVGYPATPVELDQYRLMLSDGADPNIAVLDITGQDIGATLIKVERGRESAALGMPARAGQATAQLNNTGLGYGLDEPIPGLALRLNKKFNGTWYHLWQGNLDVPEHTMTNWRPVATLRALGPLTKLAGRKASTELYQNITTGEAIGHLLDAVGFPSFLRDLDPGDVTLPYWWMSDEDALTALWTIVASEGITAELYEGGDGKLVFRSRMARYDEVRSNTIQATFRNTLVDPWFHTFEYTAGYREVVNYASHERYRRTNDTGASVVWQDTPDFYYIVPPNGSITVEAIAAQPFFDALTPVAGTDYSYGFDAPTVTLERTSGQRTKITFTSGAGGTTLTGLQLRATTTINNATYVEVSTVDNAASVFDHGLRPWSGSMSKELDWATMRDNLDAIVTWKQVPRGRIKFSINAAAGPLANESTAVREIGDRIRAIETELGFDGEGWIERIEHEVRAPAGPVDGSTVGAEVTTYECAVVSVAGGSTGTGVSDTSPYPNNSVYIGGSLEDDGIATMGASLFS